MDKLNIKLERFSVKPGYVNGKAGAVCLDGAFIPG